MFFDGFQNILSGCLFHNLVLLGNVVDVWLLSNVLSKAVLFMKVIVGSTSLDFS